MEKELLVLRCEVVLQKQRRHVAHRVVDARILPVDEVKTPVLILYQIRRHQVVMTGQLVVTDVLQPLIKRHDLHLQLVVALVHFGVFAL